MSSETDCIKNAKKKKTTLLYKIKSWVSEYSFSLLNMSKQTNDLAFFVQI